MLDECHDIANKAFETSIRFQRRLKSLSY